MSAKPRDLGLTPLDDLFSTDESRAEAQIEKVVTDVWVWYEAVGTNSYLIYIGYA